MKQLILFFIAAFSLAANAQNMPQERGKSKMLTPEQIVQWSYSATNTGTNEYDVVLTATIQKGWVVYSQFLPKGGPKSTVVALDKIAGVTLDGAAKEFSAHTKSGLDPVFKVNVTKFYDKAVFTQHIRTNGKIKNVSGTVEFMTCNDKTCFPATELRFMVALPNKNAAPAVEPAIAAVLPKSKSKTYQPRANTTDAMPTITWKFEQIKNGTESMVLAKANIPSGWYILSTLQNDAAFPATVLRTNEAGAQLWSERGTRKFVADPNFENDKVARLEGDVMFSKTIENDAELINGTIKYTVCNANGCFSTQIKPISIQKNEKPEMLVAQMPDSAKEKDSVITDATNNETPKAEENNDAIAIAGADCADAYTVIQAAAKEDEKAVSFWWIFIQGFLAGLVALFTPCVFPMLPLTVTFFIKRSKTRAEGIRNALIYGGSIIAIYMLIGVVLTAVLGPSFGSQLSTHWLSNLIFFLVFTVFAISFFGYFELTLPSSWSNTTDTQADRGGFGGIFFMAATLVIVSFSCTGPFLGTILVQAFTGKDSVILPGGLPLNPIMGMLGFSSALAIPFGFFAMFPSLLKALPKSGGWMTTLKVVFGFVELALAIKFLSNIDLVYQFGILRWEPFLALWTMIALGAAAYLFGLFTFKPDQKEPNISMGRRFLALLFLLSAGYMGYGMVTYTQISLFGMPPPVTYNYFNQVKVEEEYRNDLNGAIKASLASGKPIFMDFTGWACVNCRKMENEVWTLPNIKKIMKGNYILTSLYTDERIALPDDKICTSKLDGKEKNTVGKRLLDIQATHFNANSQPFYVLIMPDPKNPKTLRVLNTPVGYTPDVAEFEKFLNEGLKNK
jgi:thiol:disulfide interchange protein